MGGYGSGRHEWRCNKTNSDFLVLNIDILRKKGRWRCINGVITWRLGDTVRGRISYEIAVGIMHLEWRNSGGDRITQTIPLATVCQRIGKRYYFACPACGQRVRKIYAGLKFFCRRCNRVTYTSSSESHSAYHKRLRLSDKQYRNLFKAIEYARELKQKKRVGSRMLARLNRYVMAYQYPCVK